MTAPAEKVLFADDDRIISFANSISPPIKVISALPHWVELLIPCTREGAESTQSFIAKLEADLPNELNNTIRQALRELLLNAVEWGGKLDPNRKVRIAHVRSSRMLLYRVADPGLRFQLQRSYPRCRRSDFAGIHCACGHHARSTRHAPAADSASQ